MSRSIGLCCVALIAITPTLRADDKDDEWKALKGTWKVEKAVLRGQDATDAFKTAVLMLDEGKYTVEFGGQQDKGTITLDAAKKPKQMTIAGTEGPSKGKTIVAIYEVSADELKICYALEGKEAPTAFESKTGSTTLFAVYKRDKK
jgi:uncharacterized protein (TIGR03067 family)